MRKIIIATTMLCAMIIATDTNIVSAQVPSTKEAETIVTLPTPI